MFKDNYLIVISLLGYIALRKYNSIWLQILFISLNVFILYQVRPFLYQFLIPLSLLPLWTHIKSEKIKKFIFIVGCCTGIIIWLVMQTYISGIVKMFENDTSVIGGRASPIEAIIKIIIGPTPMHYLYFKKFLVQPFCIEQSIIFFIYHILFYIVLTYWIVYCCNNLKRIIYTISNSTPRLYLTSLALAQGLVYVIIYGSADIRQRAIIILFIFLSSVSTGNIFNLKSNSWNKITLGTVGYGLLFITALNI